MITPHTCQVSSNSFLAIYVYQVQLDKSMRLQVMAENAVCEIKKKKTKKLFWNFAHSYLGFGRRNLLQIWYVFLPSLGASLQQIWLYLGK